MGRKRKSTQLKVDDDMLRAAGTLSLMHYCYRFDDCPRACRLFRLCQHNFMNTAQYGDFAHWPVSDLVKGMELIEAKLTVKCCDSDMTMTATKAEMR